MDKKRKKFYIFVILVIAVFTFSIVQIMKSRETILTSSARNSSSKQY